jgi:ferrochelatase
MKRAVLMLAHGTPEKPENVPAYLRNVTSGRPLPEQVVKEVQHRYELIGQSPLTRWTYDQAERVSAELGMPVYVGMRNWKPYIGETVKQMVDDGVAQCVAVCMAPHNSRTSVGLYRRAVVGEAGKAPFSVDFIESWHDEPLLIEAFAEHLQAGWKEASAEFGGPLPVIFTAHSVPLRTVEAGDPYEAQTRHTAELVAASIPSIKDWRFAFQSQGMSGGAWLGPTVEDTIAALANEGHKGVFVQPIGFVCDHVEVLYDVDIAFRKFAEERGMRLWRAESLNGSPTLAKAVASIARVRFAASEATTAPL